MPDDHDAKPAPAPADADAAPDATALRTQVAQLRASLDEAHDTVRVLERRQRINELLAEADARDLHTARLLTESAIEQMDDADVAEVVTDLRQHKPWLFRERGGGAAAAMSAQVEATDDPLTNAAEDVRDRGDRRSLLRYLRLRRQRQRDDR